MRLSWDTSLTFRRVGSKSAETWKALISSLQVSCCFDLTAGTSTLAEVCIEEDVKYLGVAGSD